MTSLIIITIIFLGFFIYVIYLSKSNKEKFEKQKGLIEIISILVGVWYIIFSIYSSNDSFDQTQQNFNELVTNLKNLTSISAGSKSSLDSVRQDLINLPIEINKLSKTIKNIDALADSQKALWKKQYELQKNESNKRAEIKIDAEFTSSDSLIFCDRVQIANDGNDFAKIIAINFEIQKENFKEFSIINLKVSSVSEDQSFKYYFFYGEDFNPKLIIPRKSISFSTKLIYKKIEAQVYAVTIRFSYQSSYSSGESMKVFSLVVKDGKLVKYEYPFQM